MYIYMYIYIYTCIYMCIYFPPKRSLPFAAFSNAHFYTCTFTKSHTYTHTFKHTLMNIHTNMYSYFLILYIYSCTSHIDT